MKYQAFSVYDSKVEAYLSPIFMRGPGEAIRAIVEITHTDPNHGFSRYPDDYTLFLLGTFEDDSGRITSHPNHENLGTVTELCRRLNSETDRNKRAGERELEAEAEAELEIEPEPGAINS